MLFNDRRESKKLGVLMESMYVLYIGTIFCCITDREQRKRKEGSLQQAFMRRTL